MDTVLNAIDRVIERHYGNGGVLVKRYYHNGNRGRLPHHGIATR
ncbi:MAG: hypothetical protein HW390_274 [Candidatus Brocadiaceae bacterium]|nr:hypothetical protein [Candidatus Brocadiaceae bacterium]